MKHPQVLVVERNGRLAQLLRVPCQQRGWALREPRQVEHCLELLREDCPGALVVRLGGKLEQELGLLERVHWQFPQVRLVAVGEVENPALADLAWDLGASYVHFPPVPMELLTDTIFRLVETAIGERGA
jgi:ActR/RegA family two-component response regulator